MPSCVASACLSVCLIYFKSNWLLTLYLIFLMFVMNVHNNISPKPVELEFWSFALCFFYRWPSSSKNTSFCLSICLSHLFHNVPVIVSSFRTMTPVEIHRWVRNDAQTLQWHRRGALMFLKVIRQISKSHRQKNRLFWLKFSVSRL